MLTKVDLEQDLLNTEYIIQKCRDSEVYSQNLYAALCNNRFFKNGNEWTCSWRYAGGLVAELRNLGEDYLDWYCSGLSDKEEFISEGFVTPEIRDDLLKLGWIVKPYDNKTKVQE